MIKINGIAIPSNEKLRMNLQFFADDADDVATDDVSLDKTVDPVVQKDHEQSFDINHFRSVLGLKPKEKAADKVEIDNEADDLNPEGVEEADDELDENQVEASEADKAFLEIIKSKAIYNKEPIAYESIEDAITDIQKGKNYDKVKSEAETLKSKIKSIEEVIGTDIDTALLNFKSTQEQKAIEKIIDERGYNEEDAKLLYNQQKEIEKLKRESKTKEHLESVKSQKQELKSKPYFADIEAELDQLIDDNAKNGKFIDAETAYRYLVGRDADKLIERATKAKEKTVVADMQDKQRRKQVKPQGGTVDKSVNVTPTIKNMAQAMGLSPTSIAKRVAQKIR